VRGKETEKGEGGRDKEEEEKGKGERMERGW